MNDMSLDRITAAVLEQMATTSDPRLKEIMAAAVKHLHAFARDVDLSPSEWLQGIEFMTAVGRMCTAERQEFILLSDTLGLSALVNTLHERGSSETTTRTSLLGPFYRGDAPVMPRGAQIARVCEPRDEIALWGCVTDSGGAPVRGARLSIWQTASDGLYDIQHGAGSTDCRGVFETDADGTYLLRTVRPLGYSIPMDGPVGKLVQAQGRHGMRPAHIHLLVAAPGFRELVTAIYVAGDPHIADDVVFGTADELVATISPNDSACPITGMASLRFDVKLARQTGTEATSSRVGADPSAIIG